MRTSQNPYVAHACRDMMFYRTNIESLFTRSSDKTIEIGGIMKGKPAIASLKYLVNDFYERLNCLAFGPE